MERYIIKMMGGDILEISEQEYKNLMGKSGLIFIPSLKQTINTSSISRIMPKRVHVVDNLMDRKKQITGILHDGSHVIRYFGKWYLNDGFTDDRGRPEKEVDISYYPEVARDCVPSEEEFYMKYEQLPQEERIKAILGDTPYAKLRSGEGFKKIEMDLSKYK